MVVCVEIAPWQFVHPPFAVRLVVEMLCVKYCDSFSRFHTHVWKSKWAPLTQPLFTYFHTLTCIHLSHTHVSCTHTHTHSHSYSTFSVHTICKICEECYKGWQTQPGLIINQHKLWWSYLRFLISRFNCVMSPHIPLLCCNSLDGKYNDWWLSLL